MHKEVQEMIDRVKAKGALTEKQREIILHKAEFLGENIDEIEFILETIPMVLKNDTTPEIKTEDPQIVSERKDKVKKCPACGAVINDVFMKCPDCGYVFTGTPANENLIRFGNELKRTSRTALKKQIIESVIIPNDKEDLLDFLLIFRPNVEAGKGPLYESYLKKYAESVGRARQFFSSDKDFIEHFRLYDYIIAQKKKRKRIWIGSVIILIVLAISLIYIPPVITKMRINHDIRKIKAGLYKEDSLVVKQALANFLELYKGTEDGGNKYYKMSGILKDSLAKKVSENKNVPFADMLLRSIYKIPEQYRWASKGENWDNVKMVADMHYERDYISGYDILDLFNDEYKNDQLVLQYILTKGVEWELISGDKYRAYGAAGRAFLYLSDYPQHIQEAVYNGLVDIIENTTEYVNFGYLYYTETWGKIVGEIETFKAAEIVEVDSLISKKYGIMIGDTLLEREVALRSERKKAAISGKLFRHTFLRNGDTLRVGIPYIVHKIEE